jgi:putative nucleotidyltransferase with HDIG domain
MPANNWRTGLAVAFGSAGAVSLLGLAWRASLDRERERAHHLHRALVELLLNTLSAGDARTERHSRRVADLTDALAGTFGIAGEQHSTLRVAALFHDLGKIDDRFFDILHSCDPLTPEEREKINEHPNESADILQPLEPVHPGLMEIVEAHHERWDGKGYPLELQGDEIPLEARIISAADVFDAMTQPRAYKDPMSAEQALEEIRKGSGSRFDPRVIEHLQLRPVLERWKEIVEEGRKEETAELESSLSGSYDQDDSSERQ